MSLELVFDIETNGLLDTVDQVHCIGLAVVGAKAGQLYANQSGFYNNELVSYDCLEDALEVMSAAERLVGHNIIGYDLPVLKKVLGWTPSKGTDIVDTLVLSRLIHTNLKEIAL